MAAKTARFASNQNSKTLFPALEGAQFDDELRSEDLEKVVGGMEVTIGRINSSVSLGGESILSDRILGLLVQQVLSTLNGGRE
jgi:hypothetical protein